MSIEAVNQFLQRVSEDASLQEELAQALASADDRTATTELAGKYGYEFSSDELWQEIQNRQSELERRQEAGELNEEELEAVAGGIWAGPDGTGSCFCGSGSGFCLGSSIPKPRW